MWDFIDKAVNANSDELFSLFQREAGNLGFDRLAYGCLRGDFSKVTQGLPSPAITLNYPDSWTNHYFESGYQDKDPVVVQAPRRLHAFEWKKAVRSVSTCNIQRKIVREAAECGLHNGISVPVHGPDNCFVLSFAMSEKDKPPKNINNLLELLAFQFHISNMHSLGVNEELPLMVGTKTVEVLKWVSDGYNHQQVADFAGISVDGVKYHLAQARCLLRANNTVQAVCEAIRRGLIS